MSVAPGVRWQGSPTPPPPDSPHRDREKHNSAFRHGPSSAAWPRRTCARPAASLAPPPDARLAPRLAFSKACSQGRDTGLRARLRCHYLEIFNTFWRRASPGLRGQLRPGFPAAARTVRGLAGARPPARGARPCSAAPRARAATESLRLPLSLPPPTQAWDSASKYCSPFLFSAPAPLINSPAPLCPDHPGGPPARPPHSASASSVRHRGPSQSSLPAAASVLPQTSCFQGRGCSWGPWSERTGPKGVATPPSRVSQGGRAESVPARSEMLYYSFTSLNLRLNSTSSVEFSPNIK